MYKTSSRKKVKDPASAELAHQYALFLLNIRLRTEGEMRKKMRERGFIESIVSAEIHTLLGQKYLDDERFAEIMTDNLKRYKYHGYYMVKKKLMEKLLPQPLIQRALDEYFTLEDELAVAKKLIKKESAKPPETFEAKQKLGARLRSRGFRGDIISKIINN